MRRVKGFGIPEQSPRGTDYHLQLRDEGDPNVVRAIPRMPLKEVQIMQNQHPGN